MKTSINTLTSASGLNITFLPNGAVDAIEASGIQVNLYSATPLEGSISNLYLRVHGDSLEHTPMLGPQAKMSQSLGVDHMTSRGEWNGLNAECRLTLSDKSLSWRWRVTVRNDSDTPKTIDIVHVQDLGIASPQACRGNEAYVSQYVDHNALEHDDLGFVLCSRQNQPVAGRHPGALLGTTAGGVGFCTDGADFLGVDSRETGVAQALLQKSLPTERLQGEISLWTLQTRPRAIEPGESAEFVFFGILQEDHPEPVSDDDLRLADEAMVWKDSVPEGDTGAPLATAPNLFTTSPYFESRELSAAEIDEAFGTERRHEERDDDGLLSFFRDADGTHVILKRKGTITERPTAQILFSTPALIPDEPRVSTTTFMNGVFNSQVCVGNPRFHRLLGVARAPFDALRSFGQRVFIKCDDVYQLLGAPSAHEIGVDFCRWLYVGDDETIEITTTVTPSGVVRTDIATASGAPREFVITHGLARGTDAADSLPSVNIDAAKGIVECRPAADTPMARVNPDGRFYFLAPGVDAIDAMGGDGLLCDDSVSQGAAQFVIRTKPTARFTIGMMGVFDDDNSATVNAAMASLKETDERDSSYWTDLLAATQLDGNDETDAAKLSDMLAFFSHNALVHYLVPHGIEQFNGGGWGTRDVCQGPIELLLALRKHDAARHVLTLIFSHQYEDGDWPQAFMFDQHFDRAAGGSHGDIIYWPLKALCDYLEATGDFSLLDEALPYCERGGGFTSERASIAEHARRLVDNVCTQFVEGTSLPSYGGGDWNDSMTPADPSMKRRMVSGWTIGLAYQSFRRYVEVCRRADDTTMADRLADLCDRVRDDFNEHLIADGTVAGYVYFGEDGSRRRLLHPSDDETGIHYRLLPMTRGIIGEIYSPEQARHHYDTMREHLVCPDGARLMNRPPEYRGGVQRHFQRAETATFVGREIGVMYVHAHIRYIEAMAKLGEADELFDAVQKVIPISLDKAIPTSAPRQCNAYFSSSDAAFTSRVDAQENYDRVRNGTIAFKGGWRVYSSGPGIYINQVVSNMLGARLHYDCLIIDPVLPKRLDGIRYTTEIEGRQLEFTYCVSAAGHSPKRVEVNGEEWTDLAYSPNPYRQGGAVLPLSRLLSLLEPDALNHIEIRL